MVKHAVKPSCFLESLVLLSVRDEEASRAVVLKVWPPARSNRGPGTWKKGTFKPHLGPAE